MKTVAVLLPALLASCLAPASDAPVVPAAPGLLVINEVTWSRLGPDGAMDPADWVELFNPAADRAVDVGECVLKDDNDEHHLTLPKGMIVAPRAFLVMRKAASPAVAGGLRYGFGLARDDSVRLFDAHGTLLDFVSFDGLPMGQSKGRYPDGLGSAHPLPSSTPGEANVQPPSCDGPSRIQ